MPLESWARDSNLYDDTKKGYLYKFEWYDGNMTQVVIYLAMKTRIDKDRQGAHKENGNGS